METSEDIKAMVRDKYATIANQSKTMNAASCCGATGCGEGVDYTIFSENYSKLDGYVADADLGLGCGIPTQYARIKKGDTVLDLGSGAGNDCFVARTLAGESGKIIGVDMTEAMIDKARENAEKLNFNNVEFRLGEIEKLPLSANRVDVVLSNCVLNLVPDKQKAFAEILRVLKPGGHFSISDVVTSGPLPESTRKVAELYAGCVSGAIQEADYLGIIAKTGFVNVRVEKKKQIEIPEEILAQYMDAGALAELRASGAGIFSITVYGEKASEACCAPGCCN